jgi:hypothetical protein
MRIKNYLGAKVNPGTRIKSGSKESYGSIVALPVSRTSGERWRLGGCPRCHGDVFLDSEDGQMIGHCLQCGYVGLRVIMQEQEPIVSE